MNEVEKVNPWRVSFGTMFHMANESHLFRTREQLVDDGLVLSGNVFNRDDECYLPLYEAKMMHQFTHRYGDYAMRPEGSLDTELPRIPSTRLAEPNYVVQPRYWIPESEVVKKTANVPGALFQALEADSEKMMWQVLVTWFAGYHLRRGVEKAGVELLLRATGNLFKSGVESFNDWLAARSWDEQWPLEQKDFDILNSSDSYREVLERIIEARSPKWLLAFRNIARATDERSFVCAALPAAAVAHSLHLLSLHDAGSMTLLLSNLSATVFDYCVRQKLGGSNMSYFYVEQFPVLPPYVQRRVA